MDDFDFLKAFVNVDILKVEAVGEVVGRAIGSLFKGMVAAGVEEHTAIAILTSAFTIAVDAVLKHGSRGSN